MKKVIFKNTLRAVCLTPKMEEHYNEILKGNEDNDLLNNVFSTYYHYHNKECKIYYKFEENKHVFYISFYNFYNDSMEYNPEINDKIIFSIPSYQECVKSLPNFEPLNSYIRAYKEEDIIKLD